MACNVALLRTDLSIYYNLYEDLQRIHINNRNELRKYYIYRRDDGTTEILSFRVYK